MTREGIIGVQIIMDIESLPTKLLMEDGYGGL
jgi:hypothetical protein